MKSKIKSVRSFIALLLSLIMIFTMAVPAFAMEERRNSFSSISELPDNQTLENTKQILDILMNFEFRASENIKRMKEYSESWVGLANSYFGTAIGAATKISRIISLINGSITLLQRLGVIEGEEDKTQSILDGINSIKLTVNEIDKKVDKIQETLVSEFSELDMKFQEQEYNHYKDDVWAQFYSNAVLPLLNYQNEYNDDVRWLLVDYIEQWQGADGDCPTDLRALYGKNDNGEFYQVYSGKNMGDAGSVLPRAPKTSIDSVPVEYSVTIPAEYISANLDERTTLTADKCTDKLIEALEKGVYDAAQDKKLSAYDGFDTEWAYMTEAEKNETAKTFAKDLADSLAFACAYNAANERRFASNVKSAYDNFTKWTQGEESLTSPAYAQFKMLALTHGFEGEIRDEAEAVIAYLMLMNIDFATFTQTVVSLSKAHDESAAEDIQNGWIKSETSIYNDYAKFMTGNPNYCYQLGKNIEYKNTTITSDLSFVYSTFYNQYNDRLADYNDYYKSSPWVLSEKGVTYSSDKETALKQKAASGEDLQKRSISTKEAKLIYTMYRSSGTKGSLADYLAANKVTLDAENVSDQLITSFNKGDFDLSSGLKMKYYNVVSLNGYGFTNGGMYAVNTDTSEKCENKYFGVHDYATGGLFNMNDGSFDENARLVSRAFYGESNTFTIDEMYLFSTANTVYNTVKLSKSEVENRGIAYDNTQEDYFTVDVDFNADYGMIVSEENNSYTFPESTKTVPDNVFGTALRYSKITFMGVPETIGDSAFEGVGTAKNRCLLVVPEGFNVGSLEESWHGGYFGDVNITLMKNDGTNEEKTVAAVNGAPIPTVLCPFSAPEGRIFKGWSYSASDNNPASNNNLVVAGQTLYAVWGYDHEHDFEVSKKGTPVRCTSDGSTDELTCKICGFKENSHNILAYGHSCEFTLQSDGTYLAECVHGDYSVFLSPRVFGDFTVWSENNSSNDVTVVPNKYEGDCISVNTSGVYVVANNNPSQRTNDYISVNDGVKASIGLAGVNIAPFTRVPAINAGNGTVHITLVDGTENTLAGGGDRSAIEAGGNLIFDGNGSLVATAQVSAAISTSGANTVFNSGRITAESSETCGIGVRNGSKDKKIVISENACVYSKNGLGAAAVNEDGENVYPVCIRNENNEAIVIDGKEFPYTNAPGETSAYVFLTAEEHEITVGGEPLNYEMIDERFYFEKEYGDFTVTLTSEDSVSYADGVLTVNTSAPVKIRNTDSAEPTTDRIFVRFGINANITLNGVFIDGTVNDVSPIKIANGSSGDVKITLAENSENVLRGGSNCAGLSKNGSLGTLTIDGKGALVVSGGFDSAAIGSDNGYVVHGIIINDGIIDATATSYRAAAIGSGCVDADAAPSGEKVYTAEGIIINGGRITARSTDSAAIGAGDNDSVDGKTFCAKDIIINGGTVIAQSERAAYTIGAGVYAKAENIRINGGVVTAESTVSGVSGGIGANLGSGNIVIEPMASVKAQINDNTINSSGENVSLDVISTETDKRISVNGVLFPYSNHNGEKKVYIYYSRKDTVTKVPCFDIEESDRGTVSANTEVPKTGDTVTLKAVAKDGYVFRGFETTPEVEIKDNSFTMPEYSVSIKAVFSRIGKITVKDCENCTVTPSKSVAASGEKITLRIVPDTGMKFSRWDVSSENVEVTNNSFIMPEEDIVISGICTPVSYKVAWDIMGYTTSTFVPYGAHIDKPVNPERGGYTFNGWTPEVPETMPAENLSFSAVFTPITYYATFVAGGKTIAKVPYTVETKAIDEPSIPQKTGYISTWESYRFDVGGITVNAEYTPEIYMARFVADGVVVDEIPYTMETISINPPMIPNKDGFTAKWSDYTLSAGGITVNAVYTASTHEHTFSTKYSTNEYMHWYASTCGHEDIAKGLGEHTFGSGIKAGSATIYVCTECSYVKIVTDELAELRAAAIAELESAAGTNRSAAMQSAFDLAKAAVERAATAEEIASAKESGLAVIHASEFAIGNCTVSSNFIYGLEPMLTEASFGENYIVNDTVSVEYKTSSKDVLGTGSTVNVTYFSGNTDTYSIVIFGDVNGDGWYDGQDAMLVKLLANGMLTKDSVTEAQYMAADCNHDGIIDSLDVELLDEAGILRAQVNQSDASFATSSAYAEYLNLIDQTVEPEVSETEPEKENTDDVTTLSFFDRIVNLIKEIAAIIKSVFSLIK